MRGLQTEFSFTLPLGYVDGSGGLHKSGTMRLATAADEILPLRDPRVNTNQAYLVVILLSRVITRLGSLSDADITPNTIENLFSADLAYLQNFYRQVNENGSTQIEAMCPTCSTRFAVAMDNGTPGES